MKDDFYKRAFGGTSDGDGGKNNDNKDNDRGYGGGYYYSPDFEMSSLGEAKRSISRCGLSLAVFSCVSYAVIGLTYLFLILFARDSFAEILSNVYFTWILNVVSMYLVSFPVLFFMVRNIDKVKKPKSRMGIDEFVIALFISMTFMTVGNLIGVNLNTWIGTLLGREIDNSVSELITESPMWLVFLVVVVIGPIVEELIFRRLLIDRLSVFGDRFAIIVTAIAFGLFHGNFYQFFYAAGLGLILGYVYTKTRSLRYPVLLHMIINFLGSVVAIPISEMALELEDIMLVMEAGGEVDYARYIQIAGILLAYILAEYGMAIAGGVILFNKIRNRDIYVSRKCEIYIPKERSFSVTVLNFGVIAFLVISLIQFVISIFFS